MSRRPFWTVATTVPSLIMAAVFATALVSPSRGEVLGPLDGDAEQGTLIPWFTGASGAGFVDVHDSSNPYAGSYDFKVGNTVASTPFTGGNYGDFRSLVFALGAAAKGNQPITFTFAYQLPGAVASGDDILAQLIFYENYGAGGNGDGFVGQYDVALGSSSGNSAMAAYAPFTRGGIVAPATAEYASIRVSANIFLPWSSGSAYFDDFSVTTQPNSVPELGSASLGSACALCAGVLALLERRRRAA